MDKFYFFYLSYLVNYFVPLPFKLSVDRSLRKFRVQICNSVNEAKEILTNANRTAADVERVSPMFRMHKVERLILYPLSNRNYAIWRNNFPNFSKLALKFYLSIFIINTNYIALQLFVFFVNQKINLLLLISNASKFKWNDIQSKYRILKNSIVKKKNLKYIHISKF